VIAVVGDVHFGVKNSSSFYLDRTETFFKEFFKLVESNRIDEIFLLGDFLDDSL
jgi:UDP-2,3-diacylglucosamine pyrophosphatase LpxH